MAIVTNYTNMLNDWLGYRLMFRDVMKYTYIMQKTTDKPRNWHGGEIPAPFESGQSMNIRGNATLLGEDDIQIDQVVRGKIPGHRQIHGSLISYPRDFIQHGTGRIPRDTFLRLKMNEIITRAKAGFQFIFSHAILNGGPLARTTAVGTATGGKLTVDNPQNLVVGQLLTLTKPGATRATPVKVWVKYIDTNTKVITLATDKTLGTVYGSLTAYATNSQLFPYDFDKANASFTSFPAQVLPGSHPEGDTTLFGVTKEYYPYLQSTARNNNSAATTRAQLLDALYGLIEDCAVYGSIIKNGQFGKRMNETGNKKGKSFGPRVDVVMSLQKIGVFKKYFLDKRGDYFRSMPGQVVFYDASSFVLLGPTGEPIRFIGVKSMRDDMIYLLGEDVTSFPTLNFIDFYKDHQGNKWYTRRSEQTGRSYICDYYLYGEFVVKRPSGCGVLYGLNKSSTFVA